MRAFPAPGLAIAWTILSFLSSGILVAQDWETSLHRDHRQTVKHQIFPAMPAALASQDPVALAWSYLRAQAADFGLTPDLYGIKLASQQESLLGYHLHFAQDQNGTAIEAAEVIISVLKSDNRIYQVYSNVQPRTMTTALNKNRLSLDSAYDRAWNFLGVQGKLLAAPTAVPLYIMEADHLRSVWRVELSTTEPYGAWKVYVDAETGKIVRYEDQRISHKPWEQKLLQAAQGPLSNRRASFAAWEKAAQKSQVDDTSSLAQGRAKVFDPDPRTTLVDSTLQDTSGAERFAAAYFQRDLRDIRFDGFVYRLEGPWVKIEDFDPPTEIPSKTNNGQWTSVRGSNAFNDAMTYYHIDQSQRYMQTLGFTGTKGIQFGPIVADSNGVNGDDNSYFDPGNNRLAFGHGCVDDNEDADVILHEYGHAIQHSINDNWSGGDCGAMGEGFGDYWAASYSLSAANGPRYKPNEIYSWDGHGDGNSCWPGRVLDAVSAQYDPTRSYGAHTTIDGGFQSDELWSTPLFQSLLQLKAMGIPREQVDSIILQSHFGLGANISMRDMAETTILTAQQLYTGPHAKVFRDNFLRHGIIDEPHAVLKAELSSVQDSGNNAVIDPGEEVNLSFLLSNTGNLMATHVQVVLSSSDSSVSILQGVSAYPDLEAKQSAGNIDALRIRVASDTACGTLLKLQLLVNYDNGKSSSFPIQLRVGQPLGIAGQSTPKLFIPDAESKGVVDTISLQSTGIVSKEFKVGLEIRHPYQGDLRVVLTSPSGKQVVLHDRTGISTHDLVGTYPVTLTPKDSLDTLLGEALNGSWQLQVADQASGDVGTFQAWSLADVSSFLCQP